MFLNEQINIGSSKVIAEVKTMFRNNHEKNEVFVPYNLDHWKWGLINGENGWDRAWPRDQEALQGWERESEETEWLDHRQRPLRDLTGDCGTHSGNQSSGKASLLLKWARGQNWITVWKKLSSTQQSNAGTQAQRHKN